VVWKNCLVSKRKQQEQFEVFYNLRPWAGEREESFSRYLLEDYVRLERCCLGLGLHLRLPLSACFQWHVLRNFDQERSIEGDA
jgi:hypothetical protein